MHENITAFTKEEIKQLAVNSPINREEFIAKLIQNLHDAAQRGLISPGDMNNNSTLRRIYQNIDWAELDSEAADNYGQDIFFNEEGTGLYATLKANIAERIQLNDYRKIDVTVDNWENHFWNDSMAQLLQILAQRLDPSAIKAYENSGLLIELIDEDSLGKIDIEHLRGGLAPSDTDTKHFAALRIIDIMNADAGNSFECENGTYWYGLFLENGTITIKDEANHSLDITVENILLNEDGTKILQPAFAGATIKKDDIITAFELCYSGTIPAPDFTSFNNTCSIGFKGISYTFKIVKEPWVIPWYNIDADTYSRVRGEDKKVSALTNEEKMGFTRTKSEGEDSHWIRLLMPQYKRKVEVEDLDRNFWVIGQVLTGISIYLFDENGSLNATLKGLLKELAQIWENTLYLWSALDLLNQKRSYANVHTEVVVLSYNELYPYLKYDNFDNIDEDVEVSISNALNYLIQMYPDYNLCIMLYIRKNNYEQNYYSEVVLPGIWLYDRNDDTPEWKILPFSGGEEVSLNDFEDYVYGINELDYSYQYIAPLSSADKISVKDETRFYGLVRDVIDLDVEYDVETQKWTFDTDSISIKFYDIGQSLVDDLGTKPLIYSKNLSTAYDKAFVQGDTLTLTENQVTPLTPEETGLASTPIKKGYYQGELLSGSLDTRRINYHIINLGKRSLLPFFKSMQDILTNYSSDDEYYTNMRQEDSMVLKAILSNIFEFNKLGKEAFWTAQNPEDLFSNSSLTYYFGGYNNDYTDLQGKATRENAPYSRYSYDNGQGLKFYEEEGRKHDTTAIEYWKSQTESAFSSSQKIDEEAILLVEGERDYNYSDDGGAYAQPGVTCYNYYPYSDSDRQTEKLGFPAPMMSPYRGRPMINTGAALMFVIGGREVSSFYTQHHSINNYEGTGILQVSGPFVPDETHNDKMCWEVKRSGDSEKHWVPIETIVNDNYLIKDVISNYGSGGTGFDQDLVMRRKTDDDLTEDNWLVCSIRQHVNTPHFVYERDGATIPTGYEDYFYSMDNCVGDAYEGLVKDWATTYANNGEATIKSVGDRIKAYFYGTDGTDAGIFSTTYYTDGDTAMKQYIDDFVTYVSTQKRKTDERIPDYWFYAQAVLYNKYSELYKEQCYLYDNNNNWGTKINTIKETVAPDLEFVHYHSLGIPDPYGNTYTDRVFVAGYVGANIGIYIFGPQLSSGAIYGRRAICRREVFENGQYHLTYENGLHDEFNNVDILREDYIVVSNSQINHNIEKYKTLHTGKIGSDGNYYYHNIYGQFPDDDNTKTYNISWEDDLITWDPD